ncbi:MAG: ELM1/GtrOC1 family putative glycosyltransferase [Aliidongia sp.]
MISAGGRAAAPALAVREAAAGQCIAVQIQNPKIAPRHFDLMLIPEHDKLRAPNVIVTRGAVHRVTAAKLAEAAEACAAPGAFAASARRRADRRRRRLCADAGAHDGSSQPACRPGRSRRRG